AMQAEAESSEPQEIACPKCQTVNEAGWSFCQQCGSKLPKPPAPQPAPSDNKAQQGFKTVPTETPTSTPSNPPDAKMAPAGAIAGKENAESEKAFPPPPAAKPPISPAQPPPTRGQEIPQGLKTVVAEPVMKPPPQKPAPKQDAPLPGKQPQPLAEKVEALSSPPRPGGVACQQCGSMNNPGSPYCGNCGSIITIAKTIVMSSPIAPVKGSLHLVMEGGQSGESYELNDETVIGRASGDIVFPHDGFMSGRHAVIKRRGNSFVLLDEGSRNGTFIKIKDEIELKPGDMILVGKQLFRFDQE
ncbi:MAG TPA: FHA domain-containing protein, partial [Blastocatellia bacterium]